ncbi:hypothetical protein BFP76_05120 [Amylibacter kogurei]|uniref:Sulfotransferase domain-containing protein n=1 Tax=Paramylibacter kogurei TaxID=1889778 RepID=A0A2G5K799_9RHOB|nr:sulfotransferase domain-containing protein [Amylibacter kogurei]PIB24574.1 hypothetical protein BFP76_05120 [Amylibacter kogurei]
MSILTHRFPTTTHPLGAKTVFCYGMTKCGSTLAFETTRSALELSGFPQPRLSESALGISRKINFCQHLNSNNINALKNEVRAIGHPIAIKTHTRPDPVVINMIDQGDALVQATYRDPREMALSMLDHGRKSRQSGMNAFSEIKDLDDAMRNIRSQIDSLTQWLYRPNCLPIYYSDLAFSQIDTTRRILAQLQLDIDPRRVIKHVAQNRFTQMNKAVRDRYRHEMTRTQSRAFRRAFPQFYDTLIKQRKSLSGFGEPPLRDGYELV